MRLACQFQPIGDVTVIPCWCRRHELAPAGQPAAPGREQVVAVLFCDIRNFTSIADQRLPFDTQHTQLSQYVT